MGGAVRIRPARPADLEEILSLCGEHAAFEKAAFSPREARGPLRRLLFGKRPRLRCLVAETGGRLAAYATFAAEISTWRASLYLHMDCLFVREAFRNAGLGRRLLERVARAAREMGCSIVEWQTPAWNADAMRFYDRAGAVGSPKMRYRWTLRTRKRAAARAAAPTAR